MARATNSMGWARLPALLILVFLLGYLLQSRPGAAVFHLPDGQGTVAVPASLEGWQLQAGDGSLIATGYTRFHLAELEVEQTSLPARCDLAAALDARHAAAAQSHEHYVAERRGEFTRIGEARVPTARATYDVTILGRKLRMVQQDLYFIMQRHYVRIGLRFPAFLEPYFWTDMEYIAGHVRLAQ